MKFSEQKYNQEWANWERHMENAKVHLEAAADLNSCIKDEEKTTQLSSEKIQIAMDEL